MRFSKPKTNISQDGGRGRSILLPFRISWRHCLQKVKVYQQTKSRRHISIHACGWCGSSSSIRAPILKFVGFAIRKIWRTMCVSINGPGNPDLWPFDLETSMRVASKVGTFLPNMGTLGLWVFKLFAMFSTDGWTDKSNAYCSFPTGAGHNTTPCRATYHLVSSSSVGPSRMGFTVSTSLGHAHLA